MREKRRKQIKCRQQTIYHRKITCVQRNTEKVDKAKLLFSEDC